MKTVWIDASSGVAGDMLLGALVDVGVPIEALQKAIDPLGLGIRFEPESVRRSALGATLMHVKVPEPAVLRHLPEILELLSALPDDLANKAGAVFTRLAEAEAAVHRMPIEKVHFHEVGALDCIADIVGVMAGFTHLGPAQVSCSPIGLGSGSAVTQHGRIPVPVPAVLELVRGIPCASGPAPFESATPTGAALLVSLADDWSAMPSMSVDRTGTGAGARDSSDFANVVRLVVGDIDDTSTRIEEAVQIEANVDDLDPRVWPRAIQVILRAGADDAWVSPITMKKGRPAFTLGAMCHPSKVESVRSAVFQETSTIGLREFRVAKHLLDRWESSVEIDGQRIGVKLAAHGGKIVNRSVEWDDVDAAAQNLGRSTKEVLAQATELANGLND